MELITNIIVFEDGTYFNGVKGKLVRRTKHFKDAKIMDKISYRDNIWLKDYHVKWELKSVKYILEIL